MSNLYKNFRVQKPEDNVRVIDSDELLREKSVLFHLRDQQDRNCETDTEDEEAAQVSIPDHSELIRKAEEKAVKILAEAQERAELIRQEAKQTGYQEGLAAAREEAEQERIRETDRLQKETEEIRNKMEKEHQGAMAELEPALLDVILKVLEKAIGIHFEDKKEILLHVIHNTVSNIKGCRQFQIRVNESQRGFLEDNKETIKSRIGSDVELHIISDSDLEKNQCLIETETGIFECGYDIHMRNLIRDLRTLSIRGVE